MNVCVIPARGGSTRIPRKNIKLFHGKPIIAYAINTAELSCLFERIIVSTDDGEIAAVSMSYGAEIVMRSDRMSQNDVGTQEVMQDALQDIDCLYACCLYATTPLLTTGALQFGFAELQRTGKPYVYAVDEAGFDVGQFYIGEAQAFIEGVPLEGNSAHVVIPQRRAIDINTPEDWARAEKVFEELKNED